MLRGASVRSTWMRIDWAARPGARRTQQRSNKRVEHRLAERNRTSKHSARRLSKAARHRKRRRLSKLFAIDGSPVRFVGEIERPSLGGSVYAGSKVVELVGIEPTASSLRTTRSPS